jgi:hypothetical protein
MPKDRLFATGWVHVFEEDTAEGAVFRPEGDDIPLSRRPRERLELDPDGKARVFVQGPDDRYIEQPAAWVDEDGALVVRTRKGSVLQIVERTPTRLVVKMHGRGSPK